MKKKELCRAAVFILIFLFLLRSVTYIIRVNGQPKDIFTGFYAEKKNSIDTLFIGSSAVYTYYSCPQLYGEHGFTVYPLSSGSQSTKAIRYLIEEAKKTQSPELVVIELRMFLYEDKGVFGNYSFIRGVTDNMKYSYQRIRTIQALYPEPDPNFESEDIATFYFDIMKYHSNWKTMVLPEQLKCIFYEKKHPLKGYAFNTGVIPNTAPEIEADIAPAPMSADQEVILRDLLEFLKEHDQQALFVVSPCYDVPEDQAMFRSMEELITAEGFDFLDMNNCYEEIGIDFGTDYYDGTGHVNALGSEKVTAFLGNYLDTHYTLPDHRGDTRYTSWEEAYALWQTGQEEALLVINEKIESGSYDVIY